MIFEQSIKVISCIHDSLYERTQTRTLEQGAKVQDRACGDKGRQDHRLSLRKNTTSIQTR
jgi:hypothetical protein